MHDDHIEVRRIVKSVLEDCTNCRHSHDIDDFRVVGRNGNLWMLGISCSHCNAESFVAAVVGDDEVNEIDAVMGDADEDTPDDLIDESDTITVDDVLDMHEFLESFNGDFHGLFARRRR